MSEKKLKILIVDDNEEDRILMKTALRPNEWQFEIHEAKDLKSTLEKVKENNFDVIMLDLRLPDSEGLNTVKEVRLAAEDPAVIVLTGLKDETISFEALHQGIDDYLVKGLVDHSLIIRSIRYSIERKKVQKDLKEALEHNRRILAAISSILIGVDEQGCVTHWNSIAETTFGIPANEIIGKSFFEVSILWDIQKVKKMINEALDKKDRSWLDDIYFKLNSGKEGILGFSINPIRKEGSKNAGFLLVGVDVTERRKEEAEQLALQEHLRQRQKMDSLGTLAGGIAHDFKNILGPILGYTEMMLRTAQRNSKDFDRLERIHRSAIRAKELIDQILAFSRKGDDKKISVQLTDVVEEVVKLIKEVFPSTVEIVTQYETEEASIMANPTHMHQVVMNLCVNAGYAMREKGGRLILKVRKVKVTQDSKKLQHVLKSGEYILLEVRDTGIGIPKENLLQIFDPFFTTKPVGEGSGMGLAASHGIVERHNGLIQVESEVGVGTCFYIYFPKCNLPVQVEEEKSGQVFKGSESLLVVDDNSDLVQMMADMLESLGYTVQKTTSSSEALELFKNNPHQFNLAIVDQIMPNITGVQLAARFKEIRADFPVILCTGQEDEATIQEARKVGVEQILEKPVGLPTLAGTVRKILEK